MAKLCSITFDHSNTYHFIKRKILDLKYYNLKNVVYGNKYGKFT